MLEITHVQLGMESADKATLQLQLTYSVSLIIRSYLNQFSFVIFVLCLIRRLPIGFFNPMTWPKEVKSHIPQCNAFNYIREHMIPSFRMNTKEKRVPMTAYNQRCYTYIPCTFLRSNCLIGLSFSRNVRLDSLVSLPVSIEHVLESDRQDVELRIPGKRQSNFITDTLFV